MPKFNGTGPAGYGPGTGRGMGPCGGGQAYGRRGSGQGLGWRRFWGYYPASTTNKKEEVQILSEEADLLKKELESIESRLTELRNKK